MQIQHKKKKIDTYEFVYIYKNGAKIRVLYFKKKQKCQVDADRIQLIIYPKGEKHRGWLMTQMEAVDIINGLSKAILLAMEDEIPTFHK